MVVEGCGGFCFRVSDERNCTMTVGQWLTVARTVPVPGAALCSAEVFAGDKLPMHKQSRDCKLHSFKFTFHAPSGSHSSSACRQQHSAMLVSLSPCFSVQNCQCTHPTPAITHWPSSAPLALLPRLLLLLPSAPLSSSFQPTCPHRVGPGLWPSCLNSSLPPSCLHPSCFSQLLSPLPSRPPALTLAA
jgi:hypothetical protein